MKGVKMAKSKKRINPIVEILMNRDGMTRAEATRELERVRKGLNPIEDDPEEILAHEFGLEPDYVMDLFWD
jgi:hypothetical protein